MAEADRIIKTYLKGKESFEPAKEDFPGSENKYGLYKATHPNRDIESLSEEDAVTVYRAEVFDKLLLDRFSSNSVAYAVFLAGVMLSCTKAAVLLHQCIHYVKEGAPPPNIPIHVTEDLVAQVNNLNADEVSLLLDMYRQFHGVQLMGSAKNNPGPVLKQFILESRKEII